MEQSRKARYILNDPDVEAVGLVRRGANRTPFHFVKSLQEEETMSEDRQDTVDVAALVEKLEEAEMLNNDTLEWFKAVVNDLAERAANTPDPEPEPHADLGVEDKKAVVAFMKAVGQDKLGPRMWGMLEALTGDYEESSDTPDRDEDTPEAYSEQFQAMREEFAAKLKEEQERRAEIEARLADERHRRRLTEFSEVVRQDFAHVPTGDVTKFADAMLRLQDLDEALYEQMEQVLRAANEAIKTGDLYSQIADAGEGEEEGNDFLNYVEKVRQERFGDQKKAEGWAEAFRVAADERPDLAREYEAATRAQ